jgi:Tol biopolymer transport system component
MTDVQELFETVTRQAPAQRDPAGRQRRRQRRAVRNRKLGAFAVVAILLVGAAALARSPAFSDLEPAETPPLPLLAPGAYVLDVRSGDPEPFAAPVEGGGYTWAPSPTDPGRYAFLKEDDEGKVRVWITSVEELRQLDSPTDPMAPVWSPDGRWLAFSAGWTYPLPVPQVFVFEAATGDLAWMTEEPTGASGPAWTGDGRLLYSARRDGKVDEGLPFYPQYWIVRQVDLTIDGDSMVAGPPTTVIGEQADPAEMPAISPDGRFVAYVRRAAKTYTDAAPASLRLLDLETGTNVELVPEMRGLADPRWSPDGRTISFKVGDPIENAEAWIVDAETHEVERLARGYPFSWIDEDHVHTDVVGTPDV